MKHHTALRSLGLVLLLVTLGTVIAPNVSHSQCAFAPCDPCPTDVPPTGISWSSSGFVDMFINVNGTYCYARVCYCARETSPGNDDYYIGSIQFCDPSCAGSSFDVTDVWNQAADSLMILNPASFPCPVCPSTSRTWREVRTSCVHSEIVQISPTQQVLRISPCAGHGYCYTSYFVCCNAEGGGRQLTFASQSFSNFTCADGCTPLDCPPQ
jgi:hypothetical protein